jgi:tRNA uridine 5-carbamoylmethylation protein Kti12
MSFLVIIRGPLGVGKSTIAKQIASKIRADYISIDDVLAKNNLNQTDEREGCISETSFLKANEIILPKLNQAILKKVPIVIDGNFYHKNQIEDLINHFSSASYVFTLTAPLQVCIRRDLRRSNSYGKDATTAVYNLVSEFDYGQVIDNSSLSVEKTVNLIISKLNI